MVPLVDLCTVQAKIMDRVHLAKDQEGSMLQFLERWLYSNSVTLSGKGLANSFQVDIVLLS